MNGDVHVHEMSFAKTFAQTSLPRDMHLRAKALLTIMHATSRLEDLRIRGQPPNIRLHKLKGDRKNQWSISLANDSPWRITFEFNEGEFAEVKIENYHRG